MLEMDSDGVVRSVHAWDSVHNAATGQHSRIAGIGFLSAALLQPQIDRHSLDCLFPASNLRQSTEKPECNVHAFSIQDRTYSPNEKERFRLERPIFVLPYQEFGQHRKSEFGNSPSLIATIDARKLDENVELLSNAVVIIGGSYQSTGDLHTTPLGLRMPGAMVHANAIRAFLTGELVEEHKSWLLKLVLVSVAALIGSSAYALGLIIRHRFRPPLAQLLQLTSCILGVVVAVVVVLAIAVSWAGDELAATGTALGTMTPALAVAFEGLCGILQDVKSLLHGMVAQMSSSQASSTE
jgi:CHASE2 domain-containing sensor protein